MQAGDIPQSVFSSLNYINKNLAGVAAEGMKLQRYFILL
jgi:hypothetical protein